MENENWGSNYDRDTETMIAFIFSVILTEMVPNVHVPNVHVPNDTCIFDKTKGAKTHFPPIPTHTLTNIPNRGGEGVLLIELYWSNSLLLTKPFGIVCMPMLRYM